MTFENPALYLPCKRGTFTLGDAPMPVPGERQVVVRARAVAVNPFERLIRTVGDIITPWIDYPAVLGSDVAGDVVAVGPGVTRFQVGDRVFGYACGSEKGRGASEGAFQTHVLLNAHVIAPIPEAMAYEAAAGLPLAITTAAAALFQQDFLALSSPGPAIMPQRQTLLVWGGSTSVGYQAIQLALAAGYDVVTTASPTNHALLRGLGARAVFDRRDPGCVAAVIEAMRDRQTCGAVAIGIGSTRACIDVLAACTGNRFVAVATPPVSLDGIPAGPGRWRTLFPALASMGLVNAGLAVRARVKGVRTKFIWGGAPVNNAVGPMIFEHYLPAALAEGRHAAAPRVEVVGEDLTAIPLALERQRQGVSATKLVVRI
ncbi:zinc-binding alcohol dehydrogenase family protein [Novosphingobium sp.]|uniref:zinc-binding alcohol dehydrogenase family protein n=1 Tax=Novosphingobium sp. TaxID=1874826 RepID=UPI003BAB4421